MRALTTLALVTFLSAAVVAQSRGKHYDVDHIDIGALVRTDGTLAVDESLTYRFAGSFTFAYRDIPGPPSALTGITVSEGGRSFASLSGKAPGTFQVAPRGRSTRITWYFQARDETRTFRLSYRIAGQVHRYADVGELYYKFVGDEWDRPIRAVNVTVRWPQHVARADLRAWAHGPLNGTVQPDDDVVHLDVAPLPAHTFWEARIAFPPQLLSDVVEAGPNRAGIAAGAATQTRLQTILEGTGLTAKFISSTLVAIQFRTAAESIEVRGAPMLEQENALPGSKLHPPLRNGNGFAAMRWHHADMRWHVVGAFGVMLEIVGILRHQPIEKFFEIAPRRWIGVLHYDQATTGMLRENCDNAVFNFALAQKRFDFVGDFVGAFARCGDGEILV